MGAVWPYFKGHGPHHPHIPADAGIQCFGFKHIGQLWSAWLLLDPGVRRDERIVQSKLATMDSIVAVATAFSAMPRLAKAPAVWST